MQQAKRRLLSLGLRGALSLLLIGGLVYHLGSSEILGEMRLVPGPTLVAVVALLAGHVLIISPRWASILTALGYPIPSYQLLGSVFLGFLFNQLLPTAVGGDLIRAWHARQVGVPWDVAIHSVLFDRASAVVVVLIAIVILLPFAHPMTSESGLVWIVGIVAAAGISALSLIWVLGNNNLPIRLPETLTRTCSGFNTSLKALIRDPRMLFRVVVLSLLNQLLVAFSIWLIANGMYVAVSPLDFTLVVFATTLASTIPISVAGWGVREGTLVLLLGAYSVPPDKAFAISVLFGGCLTIASAPAALMLLGRSKPAARGGENL